jgi:hypothetical protein
MQYDNMHERIATLETKIDRMVSVDWPGVSAAIKESAREVSMLTASVKALTETVRVTNEDHERRLCQIERQSSRLVIAVAILSAMGGGALSQALRFLT